MRGRGCAPDASHKGVREVVARTVRELALVIAALGEPQRAGIEHSLQFARFDRGQSGVGPGDDHAARSPDVGGDRHLYRP